jgi:hypothetical protein
MERIYLPMMELEQLEITLCSTIVYNRIYQYFQNTTNWDHKRLPCHQYASECLWTVTNLCIWTMGRIHSPMMEVEKLEITLYSTIVYFPEYTSIFSKHNKLES